MRKLACRAALGLAALAASAVQAAPYPQSTVITDIDWDVATYRFTGTTGDIWPVTWAADDTLVTAWGDGAVGCPARVPYGVAAIESSAPGTELRTRHCGPTDSGKGKIMAIVAAGANLYARVNLQDGSAGYPVWRSGDGGRSWTRPAAPLPFLIDSFVQFGKGNAGAPGGYVYALEGRGDSINLLRVPAADAQSSSAYEYFSGTTTAPAWSASRSAARPIFSHPAGIQRPSITYIPGLGRYLLAVAHSPVENPSSDKLALYESRNIHGPWSTVEQNDSFLGMPGGHFLGMSFPVKWQTDGGTTLWAVFSCHNQGNEGACGQYHDRFNLIRATLRVGGASQGPVANADVVTTDADSPATVALLDNDTGTSLTIPGVGVPSHGQARVNSDRTVTYTPDPGYTGDDVFDYTIRDSGGRTDSATITVTVRDRVPVAVADHAATEPGEAVSIPVLANDGDPGGRALTITAASKPSNGTATVSSDRKSITYRPNAGFSGGDGFGYTVSDGRGGTARASVAVTVRAGAPPAEPVHLGSAVTPFDDESWGGWAAAATLYPGTEVGPSLAADPTDADNLITMWQQDRFSDGASRGNAGAYSADGGATWTGFTLPKLTGCSGGSWDRATNPSVTFAPNGHAYATSLVLDDLPPSDRRGRERPSAIVVQKSADKGARWSDPVPLILDTSPRLLNDGSSITGDPNDANHVYAVWDRLSAPSGAVIAPENVIGLGYAGPAMFSRTTNGGISWEPARPIYASTAAGQTIGNRIVVLPPAKGGAVIDFFTEVVGLRNTDGSARFELTLASVASSDKGASWTPSDQVRRVQAIQSLAQTRAFATTLPDTADDPDTAAVENGVRGGAGLFDVAVDFTSGDLHAVWQDARFSGGRIDQIAYSQSTDGGATWSAPIRVNLTPTDVPILRQQAFTPSVSVKSNGTVVVTYLDFRNDVGAAGQELADHWAVSCAAGCDAAGGWEGEISLTVAPINIAEAPFAAGYFLGDSNGLVAVGADSGAAFAIPGAGDPASILFQRF